MKIETTRQLGALLRDKRRKAGLTQRELASRIEASLRWVTRAEQGYSGTSIGTLLRALAALDVSLEVSQGEARSSSSSIVVPDVDAILKRAITQRPKSQKER